MVALMIEFFILICSMPKVSNDAPSGRDDRPQQTRLSVPHYSLILESSILQSLEWFEPRTKYLYPSAKFSSFTVQSLQYKRDYLLTILDQLFHRQPYSLGVLCLDS